MVVKIYVSGISGNKEVKKRQQRVLMILDSKNIKYEVVDIAEPGNEEAKEFMQSNSKSLGATVSDPTPRSALPPQIFSDDDYCGDYDQFDLANEVDEVEKFLKMPVPESETPVTSNAELKLGNGEVDSTTTPEDTPAQEENEKPKENEITETSEVTPQNAQDDEAQKETDKPPTEGAEVNSTTTEVGADTKLENGEVQEDSVSQPTDVEA